MHFGPDDKLYIAVGENATTARTRRPSPTSSARCSASTPTGRSPRTTPSSTRPRATTGPSGPWASATPSRSPSSRARGGCSSTTWGRTPGRRSTTGIAGANYGWPAVPKGTRATRGSHESALRLRARIRHPEGCAITGGAFYNPATRTVPGDVLGRVLLRRLLQRMDPALRPGERHGHRLRHRHRSPVDLHGRRRRQPLLPGARRTGGLARHLHGSQAPTITTHPASVTVAVGAPATFTVTASGTAPLSVPVAAQRRQHPGRDLADLHADRGHPRRRRSAFRAVVTNAFGTATSNAATLASPELGAHRGHHRPRATARCTRAGDTFTTRDRHRPRGRAPCPAARLHLAGGLPSRPTTPTLRAPHQRGHQRHVHHPHHGRDRGQRVVPRPPDGAGLGGPHHSVFVDVVPRVVTLTLVTQPAGLQVTLDGQPMATPLTCRAWWGVQRTLGRAVTPDQGTTTYAFGSWSDGGAATHTISHAGGRTRRTPPPSRWHGTPGLGLLGTYFDNQNFTGAGDAHRPHRGLQLGHGVPRGGDRPRHVQRALAGPGRAKVTGTHTFYTTATTGSASGSTASSSSTTGPAPRPENTGTIALDRAASDMTCAWTYYENTGRSRRAPLRGPRPGLAKEACSPGGQLHPYALLVGGLHDAGRPEMPR